jgi:ParB/RepB/Spo0J family partition protein
VAERLEEIRVDAIAPNQENPRQVFHPSSDEVLAQSIDTSGVLVPIYVFKQGKRYRLIDGERRWRQANKLGHEKIPALVRDTAPKPDENIIEMFNIHIVRAQWDEMPTALALAKIMERTGVKDRKGLRKLTGLSGEKIKDYQLILELPKRYQDAIRTGAVPMNFFVELDENVIRPLAKTRPKLAKEFTPNKLRDAFLKRRREGGLPDIIDLRKMRPIIQRAAVAAGEPDRDSRLDGVIRDLITRPNVDIERAYAQVALARVELDELGKSTRALIDAVDRLLEVTSGHDEERGELKEILDDTIDALRTRRRKLR